MKKAQFNWTVVMVVALALTVVIILAEGKFSQLAASTEASAACKTSVYEHAAAHLKVFDLSSDIVCPANNLTIQGSESSAKAQLADAMYRCWDNFGQGKLDLFSRDDIYCVVCSWVGFQDKSQTVHDFDKYLYTTMIPGKSITYMDFLNGYETPKANALIGDLSGKFKQPSMDIFGSKKYSVIFAYARGDEPIKKFFVASTSTAGLPVFIAGGIMVVAGISGVGIPFVLTAGSLISAGAGVMTIGGIEAWFEAKLRMERPEHVAFVALREYNTNELDSLGCKSLPAKQKQ